jgi:putative spermidine/putrescine transport system permease protein
VDEVTGRFPRSGYVVLAIGVIYVAVPILASMKFSLWQGNAGFSFSAYTDILRDPKFRSTLWFSFQLAIETTILTMVLMVPTVYWVHLRLPRLRPAVEMITVLPLVTPPIVLVVGLLDIFRGRAPEWFIDSPKFLVAAYVIICMPFVYRALDAGIRAIDIHTLTEAAQSLGASRTRTLLRVILPSLRNAVAISCLLCFVIVLGEYTIASIDLYETFPVYITFIGTSTAYQAAALSIISVILTFAVALVFVLIARAARPGGRKSRASAAILGPTPKTPTIN